MGNTQAQSNHNNLKPILISHPEFQNANVVRNGQGKEMIEIRTSMKSQKDFLLWEKNFKRIPKIPSVLYPQQVRYEDKGCCGSSGIAHIQYQRYPYILAEEIEIRKNNTQGHFSEAQLWLLIYSIISTAQIFHIRKIKIGDVRPQNIFMNEEGNIKVATQYSFPYGATNYEKTLTDRELVTYLGKLLCNSAPEEVKDLQLGRMKDVNDPQVVEIFSIGLTVLDAALLTSSERYYEPNGAFNSLKLNDSLRQVAKMGYSPQLVKLIQKMCELQPWDRAKVCDIVNNLRPFENEILLKKPFNLKLLKMCGENPEQSYDDISRIQMSRSSKFVDGKVFNNDGDLLDWSSLQQSKELKFEHQTAANTYKVLKQERVNSLESPPVKLTINKPPTSTNPPQPVQHSIAPQNNNF